MRILRSHAHLISFIVLAFSYISGLSPVARAQSEQPEPPAQHVRKLNNRLLDVFAQHQSKPAADAPGLKDQAGAIIQERAAALEELIQQNPSEAVGLAFAVDALSKLTDAFPESAGQLEFHGSWDGEIEYVVADSEDLKSSKNLISMSVPGETLALEFAGEEPDGLKNGDHLRMSGVRVGNHVAAETGEIVTSSTSGLTADGASTSLLTTTSSSCTTTSTQSSVVLLVTFPGAATPNITPASVHDTFFATAGRSLSEYWREASFGQTTAAGDVFGWYTLDAKYGCNDYSSIRAAAIRAADADVDFTKYNRIFVIYPGDGTCNYGGYSTIGCGSLSSGDGSFSASTSWMQSSYFTNRDDGVKLTIHEAGHGLGLHHASSRDFGNEPLGAPGTAGALSDYGDNFSTMGYWNFGHYAAPHKAQLGWIGAGKGVQTVQSNGSFSLSPAEINGSLQALKIQRGTSASDFVWVEYRQPLGIFDSTLSSQIFSGATIHYQDSTTGIHTHLLDYTSTSSFFDPALAAGQTWTDPYTNLSISVGAATSAALGVTVSYGSIPCVESNPTVTLSPSNPSITAGSTVNYTVSVKNNDSSTCPPKTYNLTSLAPSTWPTSFSQTSISLAPGASAAATMSKAAPAASTPGTYAVDAGAQSAGGSASAAANVTVLSAPPPLSVTISTSAAAYSAPTVADFRAKVSTANPVSGATVTFYLTRPDGSVLQKTVATDSAGQAVWSDRLTRKDKLGTYQVSATAAYGSQVATAAPVSFQLK